MTDFVFFFFFFRFFLNIQKVSVYVISTQLTYLRNLEGELYILGLVFLFGWVVKTFKLYEIFYDKFVAFLAAR